MGDKAREMMLDAVGLSFVPLYRVFGPISMLLLMLFFIIGITRIFLTIIVRAVIITRARGCSPWIFAAVWGTVYHILLTPVKWQMTQLATLQRMLASRWKMRPLPVATRFTLLGS